MRYRCQRETRRWHQQASAGATWGRGEGPYATTMKAGCDSSWRGWSGPERPSRDFLPRTWGWWKAGPRVQVSALSGCEAQGRAWGIFLMLVSGRWIILYIHGHWGNGCLPVSACCLYKHTFTYVRMLLFLVSDKRFSSHIYRLLTAQNYLWPLKTTNL